MTKKALAKKAPAKKAPAKKATAKKKTTKKALTKRGKGSLAVMDPLQRYLNEVGRFDLLTPEEEHELGVKYKESEDPDYAYQLVTANLRLVVKIALEHRSYYQNLLDLVQEGNIGLMQAVKPPAR